MQLRVVAYLALSFGAFWLATPLASVSPALPLVIASLAPGLVALLVTAATGGRGDARVILASLGRWRVSPAWYVAAIGMPIGASVAVLAGSVASGATAAIDLGSALPLAPAIVAFAAGEELGWRGFLLPRMLARMPALTAALVIGLIHAAYHLPLWLAPGMGAPAYSFVAFTLASLAFGVVWTWLYLGSGGSVLITTLFHGSINVAGIALFGGLPSTSLDWLLPATYGLAAVAVLAWAGRPLARPRVAHAAT